MDIRFSELKLKDVINISDGKNLGRVCDLTFNFPQNVVAGITVTGGRGFRLTKKELFIPMCDVERIGEDAVLVKLRDGAPKPPDPRPPKPPQNCPPQNCPPQNCPPPRPPQQPYNRRSYDEYE